MAYVRTVRTASGATAVQIVHAAPNAEFVIGAYHRLFAIEASFRMSKHDLAARLI